MKPIAIASRSQTPAEKYSQQDEEGLVVYSVTKFHQYLAGRTFSICYYHIFADRPIPQCHLLAYSDGH